MSWVTQSYRVQKPDGGFKIVTRQVWTGPTSPPAAARPDPKKSHPNSSENFKRPPLPTVHNPGFSPVLPTTQGTHLWKALAYHNASILAALTPPRISSLGSRARSGTVSPIAQSPLAQAVRARSLAVEKQIEKRDKYDVVSAAKAGDVNAAKTLEQMVIDARAAQVASGGQALDRQLILNLDKAYDQHVEFVSSNYIKKVDELKALYKQDKDGKLLAPVSQAAADKVRTIIGSPEFKNLESEYVRLFGKDLTQGSYFKTKTARNDIATNQYNYLVSVQEKAMQSRIAALRASGQTAEADSLQTNITAQSLGSVEDPKAPIVAGRTSWKWVTNPDTGQTTQVQRTVGEEYAYRKALYNAEMTRKYNEIHNQEVLDASEANRFRLHSDPTIQAQSQAIVDAMKVNGLTDITGVQLSKVIKTAMRAWEDKNRGLFTTTGRGIDTSAYAKAHDRYEQGLYAVLHATRPGILDNALDTPGVVGALNTLGALGSVLGSGLKYWATFASQKPAEFILAADNLDYTLFPRSIQLQIDTAVKQKMLDPKFLYYTKRAEGNLSRQQLIERARKIAVSELGAAWARTPEGQAWQDAHPGQHVGGMGINTGRTPGEQQRLYDDLKKFSAGGDGSISFSNFANTVQRFNEYGASPFSPDSPVANLVVGGFIDPTNLLPLNFLKYAARFRFAKAAVEGLPAWKAVPKAVHTAATVSEAELKRQSMGAKFIKLMEKHGTDADTEAQRILAKLGGLDEKSTEAVIKSDIEKLAERLGIVKGTRDYKQLETFTTGKILDAYKAAGVNYHGVSAEIQAERAAADAAEKAASDARVAAERKATERVRKREDVAKAKALESATTVRHTRNVEIIHARRAVANEAKQVPTQSYRGLEVKSIDQSASGSVGGRGRTIGAAYVKPKDGVAGHILVDDRVIADQFAAKSWTTPKVEGVAALPADQFKTVAEYRSFVLSHEYHHSVSARLPSESVGAYETRINAYALRGPSLGDRLRSALPGRRQPYFPKDAAKADEATKFIGAGAEGSSTAEYARVLGSDTHFVPEDKVFISSNGSRGGRVAVTKDGVLTPEYRAIDDAIAARSTIITDVPAQRANRYNRGEVEVADYLTAHGYAETTPGHWQHTSTAPFGTPHPAELSGAWTPEHLAANPTLAAGSFLDDGVTAFQDVVTRLEARRSDLAAFDVAHPESGALRSNPRLALAKAERLVQEEAMTALARIAAQTSYLGRMTVADAESLKRLVTMVGALPDGKQLIEGLARNTVVDLWNSRLGQFIQHEDWFKTGEGAAPNPAEIQSMRVITAQRKLETLLSMSEDEWLARELQRARSALAKSRTRPTRTAQRLRIRDIERAQLVAKISKERGGSYISFETRGNFAKRVAKVHAQRAVDAFPTSEVAKFTPSPAAAVVERGRSEMVILRTAPAQEAGSLVPMRGDVSEHYVKYGPALDVVFDDVIPADRLAALGFPPDVSLGKVSIYELLDGKDELIASLKNPEFTRLITNLEERLAKQIQHITGDSAYSIQQYFSDRLLKSSDGMDTAVFDAANSRISTLVSEARGFKANTSTTLRRGAIVREATEDLPPTLAEIVDRDLRVILAKIKGAKEHGISVHAYNEVQRVMRKPLVRSFDAQRLAGEAEQLAAASGRTVKSHFDELVAVKAAKEAQAKLEELAGGEMFGHSPEQIITEFERRYSGGDTVQTFEPAPITLYQRRTLEKAVKTHLGVDDLSNESAIHEALTKHGAPPWGNKTKTREWLVENGVWTPRVAKQIQAESRSWSIFDEAAYYRSHWAFVPEWADPSVFKVGGKYRDALFDPEIYAALQHKWGIFGDNLEARFATGQMTREEMIRLRVEGSVELGQKPSRDLPLQRKYLAERLGDLVVDDQGKFIALPWVMNQDEYITHVIKGVQGTIPESFIQNAGELAVVNRLIDEGLRKYWWGYMMRGETRTFEDLLTLNAKIVHDILQDPIWLKRGQGHNLGEVLQFQKTLRQNLVFTQIAFGLTNVLDTQVKGMMLRMRLGHYLTGKSLSKAAQDLTLFHVGLDYGTQLLRDRPIHGTQRIRTAALRNEDKRFARLRTKIDQVIGVIELPAQAAGMAENATKLRFAREMYDQTLADFTRQLGVHGSPSAARALTLQFIGEEVSRLWPTAGDGPLERLFNQLSPFASYTLKNHVVFISEFMMRPGMFNTLTRVGNFVEYYNREKWNETHPLDEFGLREEPNPKQMRQIELPWAPGFFIDLSTISDASRGIDPIYDLAKGRPITVRDFAANWIRLIGPSEQNIFADIFNKFDLFPRYGWSEIRVNGFGIGRYEQVQLPWEAPWGEPADWRNSFWPWERAVQFAELAPGGFTASEVTQLATKVMLFGGLRALDRGAGLSHYYYALKGKNPAAALKLLNSADGEILKEYWLTLAENTQDFFVPKDIYDLLNPTKIDKNPWLHRQSVTYQEKMAATLDDRRALASRWDAKIATLTPDSAEMRQAKLQASTAMYAFYQQHPEIYDYYAHLKTDAEWNRFFSGVQMDSLRNAYFNLKAPKPANFKTYDLYFAAKQKWLDARAAMLRDNPLLAADLNQSRNALESSWSAVEHNWTQILGDIGTRKVAIRALKESKNFDVVDQLYLINELSGERLSQDFSEYYFDPNTDFKTLPDGISGPTQIKDGLISRVKIFSDFNSYQFSRLSLQGKQDYERKQRYGSEMKALIAKAKAGKNFGKTFAEEIRKNPWLLNEWFNNNPGKREQWAAADVHYKKMQRYGSLIHAGKFTEADAYFNSLSADDKARYYKNHPEKKAALAKKMQYMSFMDKWTNFYRHRDYAGGAAYFAKLPAWVKEQYYGAGNSQQFTGTSPYSKAMGKWVDLLKTDKVAAKAYFDKLPQAFKDRYYLKHPDQKLATDIKRTGQLGDYFAASDVGRAQYLVDNPEFAKWLKVNDPGGTKDRMLILAAYKQISSSDQWLRRIFREKYPEIFSAQAKGESSLKNTYKYLAEHPEILPAYDKWVAAVWASYAEEIKHTLGHPRPIVSDHTGQRQHGLKKRVGDHASKSAEWVRLHSI